jgi:hypothetical protein
MLIDFAISGVSESRTLENEQTRPTGSARQPASNEGAEPRQCAEEAHPPTGRIDMSKRKLRSQLDYEVGYGRPPKASQFRPGQSGNPTGARKGGKTIGVRLQELINAKVAVTESGRTRRLPRLDVMLHRLSNDAMRGDQRALKHILEFVHRYSPAGEGTVRSQEMTSDDLEILTDYLRKTASSNSEDSSTVGDDGDGESL